MTKRRVARMSIVAVAFALLCVAYAVPADAQIRGLYPPGMTATNSGVLPEAGLSYENLFQLYTFDELKGPEGKSLPVSLSASVLADQNIFIWVSKKKILGGSYAAMGILAATNNSLSSVTFGAISGGAGLGDSYLSPFTLGWNRSRADLQVAYGVMFPTGRFNAGATDNVGAGYWGQFVTAGETIYMKKDKTVNFSAFQVYEFHSKQEDTHVHPGQTFDIDYSLMTTVPLRSDMHTLLQAGIVGYGQYQTTDKSGPGVIPAVAADTRYVVNALGGGANIILPVRKTSLGIRYFKEFSNSATVQGHSVQINVAVTF